MLTEGCQEGDVNWATELCAEIGPIGLGRQTNEFLQFAVYFKSAGRSPEIEQPDESVSLSLFTSEVVLVA